MDINRMEKLAFDKMGNSKSHLKREKGYIYYHGLRTARLAIKIRKMLDERDSTKDKIIYVACLFHDIAKGIEPHAKNGSILIQEVLKNECSYEELMDIAEIIKAHNLRDSSEDWAQHIKIVQDADILDHMGTMDIWLSFTYQAYNDKSVEESIVFFNDEKYEIYLEESRNKLNYDISKKIFDDRIEFANSFIQRLRTEGKGGIFNKDFLIK